MQVDYDFTLSDILWYKIGGKAKYFIDCSTREDILQSVDLLDKNNVGRVFVCGLGSNLIFTDEYFDGAVIRVVNEENNAIFQNNDGHIEAFAGEILDKVIKFSFEKKLTGLEWAGGLPGTVGAGVRGNVGAFGDEIKDSVMSAEVLDYSSNNLLLRTLTHEELQFVYRGSLVKTHKKMIVLSAKFALEETNSEGIAKAREVYERNIKYREDRHPLTYPNCGSVFKNIKKKEEVEMVLTLYPELKEDVEKKWYGKVAAAVLLEKLGFKGYRIGDAKVSEKHALFIVNLGHAKAKDVRQIIKDIQDKFQETLGFSLEVEAEIVE